MREKVKNGLAPATLRSSNTGFRDFYRRRVPVEKRLDYYTNDRIIQAFCKKVAEKLLEYRAGVHIDKIGYFVVYRHPFNFIPTKNFRLKRYMLTFIPTDLSIFKYWNMDFKFQRNLNKQLIKNIKKGYRYLNLMQGVTKRENLYIGLRSGNAERARKKSLKNAI